MDEMDRQIAYMTYLRHRLKDDYVLMNKAAVNSDIYEKNSLDLRYVLYKYGEKLLQEPERLLQVKEFLYNSPELQHIYMITKEEIEDFCMELPRYKRPKEIIFADIPRNATGKIEKPKLRKMYGADRLVEQENKG